MAGYGLPRLQVELDGPLHSGPITSMEFSGFRAIESLQNAMKMDRPSSFSNPGQTRRAVFHQCSGLGKNGLAQRAQVKAGAADQKTRVGCGSRSPQLF